jgi:hypothetical protein
MRRLAAALAAAALVAGACGGGGKKASPKTTSSTVPLQVTTTTLPPPAILTGLPIGDRDNLDRPVLVVKVENAPDARPQAGIDKADVVYEEVVEGGVVRFLVVFQSQDAEAVGPVRSVRPVDPDVVAPMGGLFAYAAGAAPFEKAIKAAPVRLVGINQLEKAYVRRKSRKAPHNLYTTTKDLYEAAKSSDKPPPPLFTFGPSTGAAVTRAHVVMGALTSADWDWDAGKARWLRTTNGTPHVMENDVQLALANVIVQYVRYSNTSTVDPTGFRVQTADIVGTGKAIVLSGDHMVQATWTKRSARDVTTYTGPDGEAVNLATGPTWVMLAPVGAQTTTG